MSDFFWLDLRYACRVLLRKPLFSLLVIVTLGIGIGGVSLMFALVHGVLLEAPDYREPDRLVSIWKAYPSWREGSPISSLWDRIQFTYGGALRLQGDSQLLEDTAFFAGWGSAALTGGGRPEQLSIGLASWNLFQVLGVQPELGRTFLPGDDGTEGQAARPLAVLSHELWQRRFASSPGVLGRTLDLDGEPFEVVGVLPSGFRLESVIVQSVTGKSLDNGRRDLWIPIGQPGSRLEAEGNSFEVLGRMRPGVSPSQVQQEVQSLLATDEGPPDQEARVLLRQELIAGDFWAPLLLLLGGAALLWLVVCGNIAALMAGESLDRKPEIAVRSSLGARPIHLIRQLITENVLLGLLGSAAGLALSGAILQWLRQLDVGLPRLDSVSLNLPVVLFTAVTGTLSGILFGITPLLVLLRKAPVGVIRDGDRGATRPLKWRSGLIGVQAALAMLLCVTAGLLGRSLIHLGGTDPGFDPEDLITFQIQASTRDYPTQQEATRLFSTLMREMETVSGVRAVSASYGLPFPGGAPSNPLEFNRGSDVVRTVARRRTVWYNFPQTLGISLLEGRHFSALDGPDSPGVMLVSRSLAGREWPEGGVLNQRVRFQGREWTIVGVVGDVRHTSLRNDGEPTFYVPFSQLPRRNLNLVIRTTAGAVGFSALLEKVWETNPELPVAAPTTLGALIQESASSDRLRTWAMGLFGAVGALLTALGIFGGVLWSIGLRAREMGIRMALGAELHRLRRDMAVSHLLPVWVGILAGLLLSLWTSHWISSFLFGIAPLDPVAYGGALFVILAACWLASALATRHLQRVDPAQLLH